MKTTKRKGGILVHLATHPLIQRNLGLLRDKGTGPREFRRLMAETGALLACEATRDFKVIERRVSTPLGPAPAVDLAHPVLLAPILRAGLGLLEGMIKVLPDARVGFIGLRRDEITLECSNYHASLPDLLKDVEVMVLDPMLATGGSAIAAARLLKERGANRMRLVNLLAAPEGIKAFHAAFPRVPIYTAAIDRKLNSKGYILPGLGDAGDRQFGV